MGGFQVLRPLQVSVNNCVLVLRREGGSSGGFPTTMQRPAQLPMRPSLLLSSLLKSSLAEAVIVANFFDDRLYTIGDDDCYIIQGMGGLRRSNGISKPAVGTSEAAVRTLEAAGKTSGSWENLRGRDGGKKIVFSRVELPYVVLCGAAALKLNFYAIHFIEKIIHRKSNARN